jgi:N-ethylmaleimide reductase
MSKLFTNIKIGPYLFTHRVVMAPLTRMRADAGAIPNAMMVEYYSQRASKGGFQLTEGTIVAPNGSGYLGSPGLYDDSQIVGWSRVTDAVHAKGGKIFAQLYHAGRQSHDDLQPEGGKPVGPSEVPHNGMAHTKDGWTPSTMNRALELQEMPSIVEYFRAAAKRALVAGFDGVELHGANGYLIDQFLQNFVNTRADIYGGSVLNRTRLLMETVQALIEVWGSDRVAVRLSPSGTFNDMSDSDPIRLFTYVTQQLDRLNLAYLHLIEPRINGGIEDENVDQTAVASHHLRKHFSGVIIVAGGFTGASAEAIIQAGDADLVAFGRHFVANPDLPERLRLNLPLNAYDRPTFMGGNEVGYTDYPFYVAEPQLTT